MPHSSLKKVKPVKAWAIIDISERRLTKTSEAGDKQDIFAVYPTKTDAKIGLMYSSSRYGIIPVLIIPIHPKK